MAINSDPGSSPRSVEAVNDSTWAFMSEDLFYQWSDTTMALVADAASAERVADRYETVIIMDPDAIRRRSGLLFDETSILWFRGYVASDGFTSALDRVLEEFGVGVHVVAHTPVRTIGSLYDGRILAVDLERPATEMLLMVWDAGEGPYRRWRVSLGAPLEPF